MKSAKSKGSKLESFKEKAVNDLSMLGGATDPVISVGVSVTADWDGWFDGSMVRSLFDGRKGVDINEFD